MILSIPANDKIRNQLVANLIFRGTYSFEYIRCSLSKNKRKQGNDPARISRTILMENHKWNCSSCILFFFFGESGSGIKRSNHNIFKYILWEFYSQSNSMEFETKLEHLIELWFFRVIPDGRADVVVWLGILLKSIILLSHLGLFNGKLETLINEG